MKDADAKLIVDALMDQDASSADLQRKIRESDAFAGDLASMQRTWDALGELPEVEPLAGMEKRFYNQLDAYARGQQAMQQPEIPSRFVHLLRLWLFPLAAAATCLVLGIYVGQQSPTTNLLPQQVQPTEGAQVDLVGLLAHSPSERLSVVQASRTLNDPDERVLNALLHVLRTDESVNVRIGAVEALATFGKSDLVREGLVRALPMQESPVVQIALIDAINQLQDDRATESLQHLLEVDNVNPLVRKHATETLEAWR